MFNTDPTYGDVLTRVRQDFNPASPKLRLSIITYLLDSNVVGANTDVTAEADSILSWVLKDVDDFAEQMEKFSIEAGEKDSDLPDVPEEDGSTGFNGGSYL